MRPRPTDPRRERLRQIIEDGGHLERGRLPLSAGKLGKIVGTDRATVLRWIRQDFPAVYDDHFITVADLLRERGSGLEGGPTVALPLPPSIPDDDIEDEPRYSLGEMMDPVKGQLRAT